MKSEFIKNFDIQFWFPYLKSGFILLLSEFIILKMLYKNRIFYLKYFIIFKENDGFIHQNI